LLHQAHISTTLIISRKKYLELLFSFDRVGGVKRKAGPKNLEPQKFQVGETTLILRPHLWGGASGVVVSFSEGMHRIKVKTNPEGSTCPVFHTDVPASQLESSL